MEKIVLSLFLIFILFPISAGFSQEANIHSSSLSVILTSDSPYIYKDDEGYTVVVGAVKNINNLASFTNVQVHVNFYDDASSQPLETTEGGTILQVIPPLGTSPYVIKSKFPNPDISQVSVSLQKFDSSTSKSKQLSVGYSNVVLDENLRFTGVLKNGAAPINNTNVYLAFYDAFQPPRIVRVDTIPIGNVEPNRIVNFNFNEKIETRSVGFLLFSESNAFYSDFIDVKFPEPETRTKLVTISDVSVTDSQGKKLSDVKVGSPVKIQSESWIQFSADQKSEETPYTYYVQIKQSGKTPFVEFLEKHDGNYIGANKQFQSIDWVPEHGGLFFIETFVWDRDNIPIADKGPIALIIVN
ncbi:MAG: hypothetical protein JHC41_06030 [Nitrosopumilus sp.]|nr:hypothetical protein [Nitrosopumilus sp.]